MIRIDIKTILFYILFAPLPAVFMVLASEHFDPKEDDSPFGDDDKWYAKLFGSIILIIIMMLPAVFIFSIEGIEWVCTYKKKRRELFLEKL